ncbi:uncharacterized protein LOC134226736 [Armigeres subalbatus]|uniref:uncharacterized protein LOC134226736 n=1 Tax=Armigeres subalbatus TaxID=124917 RepID=UPI002ED63E80
MEISNICYSVQTIDSKQITLIQYRMAPYRRTNRKVDNCSYVRQLFQTFLDQNRAKKVPEVIPRAIPQQVNRFAIDSCLGGNLFRQGVQRNLLKAQADQANPVKKFFADTGDKLQPATRPSLANQPVNARFKRHAGSDQFVKCTVSPNVEPRGLVQWLNMRKKTSNEQRLSNKQKDQKKKVGEYLDLPGNFFSGRESMRLPFEAPKNADKTLMSVVSTFVPPATSTPFDAKRIDCPSIISDPLVELTRREIEIEPVNDCHETLQKIETIFDQFSASFCAKENTPLDQNYQKLRELWREHCMTKPSVPEPEATTASLFDRSSWEDHSFISNELYHRQQQFAPAALAESTIFDVTNLVNPCETVALNGDQQCWQPKLESTNSSFFAVPGPPARKRRTVDALLTESPPSPPSILTQDLNEMFAFGPERARHEMLNFDFDLTPAVSRTSNEFTNFDVTRHDDSFCFFPPTPRESDCITANETKFFFSPTRRGSSRANLQNTFFDLFP